MYLLIVVLLLAFNESQSIHHVLSRIPRKIEDDVVKVCVVDDGSSDDTREVAIAAGADHVWRHKRNHGVAAAFRTGVQNALRLNADVIVNLDADGQFNPDEIPPLLRPIRTGQADIVLGSRFLNGIPKSMPIIKRIGNITLGLLVSLISGKRIRDTQCGFRAFTAHAIRSIPITGIFTYTQEMVLRASFRGLRIVECPVTVKYFANRRSRVVRSVFDYAIKSLAVIMATLVSECARYIGEMYHRVCLSL